MRQLDNQKMTAMAISDDEREFFVQLGTRIAELRKAQNMTQIQMAETLGVSQQTINSYEVGRRRIPVSTLPALAKALAISIEELLGDSAKQRSGKRGPASTLQLQIEQIGLMPKAKQKFIIEMLDAMIKQQQAS